MGDLTRLLLLNKHTEEAMSNPVPYNLLDTANSIDNIARKEKK